MDRRSVGLRIKAIRKEKGLLLKEAAEGLEISPSLLIAYEDAAQEITIEELDRFADYFHVPVERLINSMYEFEVIVDAVRAFEEEVQAKGGKIVDYENMVKKAILINSYSSISRLYQDAAVIYRRYNKN